MTLVQKVDDITFRLSFYQSYTHLITSAMLKIVSDARAEAATWKQTADEAHAANLPKIENNKIIYEEVRAFMRDRGFEETYREYRKPPRKRNMELVRLPAGFVQDLRRECKTDDQYESAMRSYNSFIKSVDECEKEVEREAKRDKAEEEAKQKKAMSERELGAYLSKYDLPLDGDWNDALHHIISQNKYLRLAHYLLKNRNDWSEGYHYAGMGIDGFVVETTLDQEIFDDISSRIENWDGDGRVFRDCKHNYSELFAMVPAELMAEYNEVSEKMPSEW